MIEAVLFDLDDTLLGNHMDAFMPRYFDLIGEYARPIMERERFLQELMACTEVTVRNTDTAVSNREVFWQTFAARNDVDVAKLESFFDRFYQTRFNDLQPVTQRRPLAAKLVRACFDLGLKVVIATNPLFPYRAVTARLAWAGLPITDYAFDLVTTYENMHSTKPHPSYYREILDKIHCAPQAAVMVGDDWARDIEPTAALGIHNFWITANQQTPPNQELVTAFGTLADFFALVHDGWLRRLPASAPLPRI